MRQRKLARMQPFETELEAAGVDYKPIFFSCFGRPQPDATKLLQTLGRRLARRKGTEAHIETRRIAARIGVEIWRRAAKMLRQCVPGELSTEADEAPLSAVVLARVGAPSTVEPEPFSAADGS